jgi:hypothetical protein
VTAAIFRSNIPNFRSLKYPIIAPAEIGEIISHAGDGVSGAAEWHRSRRQPTIDRYSRCATHYECRTSSFTRGRGRSISRLKARVAPMSSHMLIGEAWDRGSMTKYRMGIFKPGHKLGLPAPLLWRRRDIFASDDAAATAAAQDLYRTHAAKRISNELLSLRQFWKIDLQVCRNGPK